MRIVIDSTHTLDMIGQAGGETREVHGLSPTGNSGAKYSPKKTPDVSLFGMTAVRVLGASAASWFLERKLYRRPAGDIASVLVRVLVARVCAAVCAFASMILVVWIVAIAHAVLSNGWSGFRTLNDAALSGASVQAARCASGMAPVLAVWALLLILTPTGFAFAFRASEIAAGAFGAMNFVPPSFAMTRYVSWPSRWILDLDSHSGAVTIALLMLAMFAFFLSHAGALGSFRSLDLFVGASRRVPRAVAPARVFAERVCTAVLAFLVPMAAAWCSAVVRATVHSRLVSREILYGPQGAWFVQGRWLFLAVLIAVAVSLSRDPRVPLVAGVLATVVLVAIAPRLNVLDSVGGNYELLRIGPVWGIAPLWVALFLCLPGCLFGIYLIARLRLGKLRWV